MVRIEECRRLTYETWELLSSDCAAKTAYRVCRGGDGVWLWWVHYLAYRERKSADTIGTLLVPWAKT